jgi:hypothetical protein
MAVKSKQPQVLMKLATECCRGNVALDCYDYCDHHHHHHHHNNSIFGDCSILLYHAVLPAVGNDSFEELPTFTFRVVQKLVGSRKLVATYSSLSYLETKATSPCVTSVTEYQSTRRHISKKYILHQQC